VNAIWILQGLKLSPLQSGALGYRDLRHHICGTWKSAGAANAEKIQTVQIIQKEPSMALGSFYVITSEF
jgi:hypothetical protein